MRVTPGMFHQVIQQLELLGRSGEVVPSSFVALEIDFDIVQNDHP